MYKLLAFLVLAANAFAQAEKDLEAAMNKEVVQGDVNGAIALYRKILSRYGSQREVAAKRGARLRRAREIQKLPATGTISADLREPVSAAMVDAKLVPSARRQA